MADSRQLDALSFRRIPDVLILTGFDGNFTIGSEQSD